MSNKAHKTKEELDAILDAVGLVLAEPYDPQKSYPQTTWLLTECTTCHTRAHYSLRFLMSKSSSTEPVCKVCYWRRWCAQEPNVESNARIVVNHLISEAEAECDHDEIEVLKAQDPIVLLRSLRSGAKRSGDVDAAEFFSGFLPPDPLTVEDAKKLVGDCGYELIDLIDQDKPGEELFVVKCRHCGRQTVNRRGDLGWGCSCHSHPTSNSLYKKHESHLLCESQEPCLKWWAHDLNDEKLFTSVTCRARKVAQWRCPACGDAFEAKVYEMTGPEPRCPRCCKKGMAGLHEEIERYKRTPVSDVPELMAAWDDERDPHETMVYPTEWMGMCPGDGQYRFKCKNGHHPYAFPYTYLQNGCPSCKAAMTREWNRQHKASLVESNPELAAEWDYDCNEKLKPEDVKSNSKREIAWVCLACGNRWIATPRNRGQTRGQTCPRCGKVLGSFAWEYPSIAEEWDPKNPVGTWEIRPHANLGFMPMWICKNNPLHRWKATLQSRTHGGGCPECADSSKSRVELDHFEAAEKLFGGARSGARVEDDTFSFPWVVDILVSYEGHNIVIEYDGAHWHDGKADTDKKKSEELLRVGYYVARLREDDLPSLQIENKQYCEIKVNSKASRPDHAIGEVKIWLDGVADLTNPAD